MGQINVNVGFDSPTLDELDKFCKTTNKSRNQVIRESVRVYIGDPESLKKKFLPKRFSEAMYIFKILKYMTKPGTDRDNYFLSYPDVLINKYGRWGKARDSITLFANIMNQLKHSLITTDRINHYPVPGSSKDKTVKEGVELHFEASLNYKDLEELEIRAMEYLINTDFNEKVMISEGVVVHKTRDELVLDNVNALLDGGEEVSREDEFDTEE